MGLFSLKKGRLEERGAEFIAVFSCAMGGYQEGGNRLFPQRHTVKGYGAMDTNTNLCKFQGGIRKKFFTMRIGQSLGREPREKGISIPGDTHNSTEQGPEQSDLI